MIRFIDTAFVGGVIFRAGMTGEFDLVTELQLIAVGDAVNVPTSRCVGQSYAGWTRNSANAAGDATKLTLASLVVPGGLMGRNSVLRITLDWYYTNSSSTKSLMTDWGTVNISAPSATTSNSHKGIIEIQNKNSLSIQSMLNFDSYGSASRAADTTKDTTKDVALDFRCQWGAAASGEFITLLGYSVWHYPGS